MAYTTLEGRRELLDTLAGAIDDIGLALASLGAAYEQLDEPTADRLEEQLFGPVQVAYGRARRTHAEFARRHGLTSRAFETPSPGLPSTGAKGFIEGRPTPPPERTAPSPRSRIRCCRWRSATPSCERV